MIKKNIYAYGHGIRIIYKMEIGPDKDESEVDSGELYLSGRVMFK